MLAYSLVVPRKPMHTSQSMVCHKRSNPTGVIPLRGSPPGTSQRVKPSSLLRISDSTYSTKNLLGASGMSRKHHRHALVVARPGERGSEQVPRVHGRVYIR